MIIKRILSLLLTVVSLHLFSQDELGQLPSKIKWEQLKTPAGKVIYPKGKEATAQRVANMVNYQKDSLTKSIGNRTTKLGIVLQNTGIVPNGYVGLAPFRSVFYTTPPEDIYTLGSIDWLDVLTIHEYRHAQQFSNSRQGRTNILYYLYGEYGWGAALNLAIPDWYFEGDAVWAETSFSHAGRGRTPSFSNQERAMALSNVEYSYKKSRNGSYKDVVPDHYRAGYTMLSFLRNEMGNEVMKPVIKDMNTLKYTFYPFSKALKANTGYTTTNLYNTAYNRANGKWKNQLSTIKITPTKNVTVIDNKNVKNYYYPQFNKDGKLFALKNSFKETDQIISIDNEGETKIVAPGINFGQYFYVNAQNFIWTEYQKNPRRGDENFSEIFIFNQKTDKKKKLTKKGKFFSPIINSTGDKVIAIHFSEDLKPSLKEINTSLEKTITSFEIGEAVTGLTFSSDEQNVIYVLKRNSKLAIWKYNLSSNEKTQLTPWTNHVIGPPRVHGSDVYYSSSYSGIDNIYKTSLNGLLEIEQLTSVTIGAYEPCVNKEGTALYFIEHTVTGRKVSSIDFKSISESRHVIKPKEPIDMKWQDETGDNAEIDDFLNNVPSVKYESTSYKGLFRGLKPHSWGVLPSNVTPSAYLDFNNYLNDLSVSLTSTYNVNEKALGYSAEVSYGKWYPLLSLGISQSNRTIGNSIFTETYDQQTVAGSLSVPLSWISRNYSISFNPEVGYSYSQISNRKWDDFSLDLPKESYSVLESGLGFSIAKRTATQNLASRLGVSLDVDYLTNTSKNNDYKFNSTLKLYLPGFGKNHSLRVEGGIQKELLSNAFQLTDEFTYTRGFVTPTVDEFISFSTEYALPIAYPDVGLGGITYFKRIILNGFYDYGQGTTLNYVPTEKQNYQSLGLEVMFDNTFLNFLPIGFGIRGSYLLNEDPLNLNEKIVPSFFIGINL